NVEDTRDLRPADLRPATDERRSYPMASAPAQAARPGLSTIEVHQPGLPPVDFYGIDDLLTPEEREVRDRTRAWVDREVIPIIGPYWERAEFPFELIPKIRELGYMGGNIRGYGCPGMSAVAANLMTIELSRGDASVSTFFGVQSGLAMTSILVCGSEEQRQEWLPQMARLEKIGAFGLTEPEIGSDAAH